MPETSGQNANLDSLNFVQIDTTAIINYLAAADLEVKKIGDPKIRAGFVNLLKSLLEELNKLHEQLIINYNSGLALFKIIREYRERILAMQKDFDALTSPPLHYGYIIRIFADDKKADIIIHNGERVNVNVLSTVEVTKLKVGQRVALSEENLTVLSVDEEWEKTGQEARVLALLDSVTVRVVTHLDETHDVLLAESLKGASIREGDILLVSNHFAFSKLPKAKEIERLFLTETPNITYEQVGGLDDKIKRIRELIEWPYLYRDRYVKHGLRPPKGILLFGPPGCGKTLTAKAVANALGQKAGGRSYFMNIKGPELLNKWVGETERQIREIFSRAKELATEKVPVIIFFDEMDALFPIRGSQISTDTAGTIVPQFTTEMDGIEDLINVIVIGATNRQDRIDPAVIRPGRFNDRIEIGRPDKVDALKIFNIYLHSGNTVLHPQYFNLDNYDGDDYIPRDRFGNARINADGTVKQYPLAKDRGKIIQYLVDMALERIFDPNKELNKLVRVTFASGRDRTLYASDFISGAVIESIVNKAKRLAFGDFISSGERPEEEGVRLVNLMAALEEEFESQAKLPSVANPNEWASIFGINERIIDVASLSEDRRKSQQQRAVERIVPTGQYL